MEAKELMPGLYWFDFPNCTDMCRTLVRFQEYYEGLKFRNKIFSFTKFKKWYREQTPGPGFTYYEDVAGCNFPSSALEPFRRGCFNPLRALEFTFLKGIEHLQGNFYIIATALGEEAHALDHGVAHGLFYLNEDYRKETTRLIEYYELELDDVYYYLDSAGYNKEVYIDEAQAYVGIDHKHLQEEGIDYPMELHNKLEKIYKKYRSMYGPRKSH